MKNPLIPLVLSFILGLFLEDLLRVPLLYLLIVLGIALSFFLASLFLKYDRSSSLSGIFLFIPLGGILLFPYLNPSYPANHIRNFIDEKTVNLEGILYQSPERTENITRIYLQTKYIYLRNRGRIPIEGKVLLFLKDISLPLSYGDRIRFDANIYEPANFYNEGGFDYKRLLNFQGIEVLGHIQDKRIVTLGEKEGSPLRGLIESLRNDLRRYLDEILPYPSREITKALILGEDQGLGKDLRKRFAITGVVHVLSISGLHIGVLAFSSIYLFLRILRLFPRLMLRVNIHKVAYFLAIFPVIFYTVFGGLKIATLRSSFMFLTYLLAALVDREKNFYNILGFAALLILIFSPPSLFSISFQLSFLSVLAIIYLTPRFSEILKEAGKASKKLSSFTTFPIVSNRYVKKVCLAMLVTLAGLLGTGPLVALYFNIFSPIGIIANLVVVPVLGFLSVILGLTGTFLFFFSHNLSRFLFILNSFLINGSLKIIEFLSALPFSYLYVSTPTYAEISLIFIGLFFLSNINKSKKMRYGLLIVSVFLLIDLSYWNFKDHFNRRLTVTFIDVGMGDSILLEFPKGPKILLDGGGERGGDFDIGERVIAPMLWKKKIKTIDKVILSHPQSDHMGGLKFILENFKVKEFWWTGRGADKEEMKRFLPILQRQKISSLYVGNGSPPLILNGTLIEFLHPPTRDIFYSKESENVKENDNSLILKLTYGRVSFLFTGDIEKEGEEKLIHLNQDLSIQVLKSPHHGSLTSSSIDLLDRLNPKVIVISVGKNNPFRLPHPLIIERYQSQGYRVFRTDKDGAIRIETDGKDLRIFPYLSDPLEIPLS